MCVGMLYWMNLDVSATMCGVWHGVGGWDDLADAEVVVGIHGVHSPWVGDGVTAWIARNDKQLLVPAC